MTRIRFSFIVPAFNEEGTIGICLKAIQAESAPDMEVIVVDNNSTDGTAVEAAELADRVIRCEVQGISAARNAGASAANGEFLCFLDADAIVRKGWLSNARKAIAKEPGCSAFSGWNYFRDSNPLRVTFYNSYHLVLYPLFFVAQVLGSGMVLGNQLVIRKDVLTRAGGFPPFVGEDLKLSKKLRALKVQTGFCPGLVASFSSRRLRKIGFWRVMGCWLQSAWRDIPDASYGLNYQARAASEKTIPPKALSL